MKGEPLGKESEYRCMVLSRYHPKLEREIAANQIVERANIKQGHVGETAWVGVFSSTLHVNNGLALIVYC